MKKILSGLGTAALGLCVLLTLLTAVTTSAFTLRPPSGPDSMGLFVLFVLPFLAWILVLLAALLGVFRGSFDWVSRLPGVPTLAVLGTTVGLGGLSVAAVIFSLEIRFATRTVVGIAGGFLLPLFVVGFVALALWTDPAALAAARWPRRAGAVLASLAFLACCGGGVLWVQDAREDARRAEERRVEDEAREAKARADAAEVAAKQDADLAALPDDTPIEKFLAHLFIDKSEEHHRKAVARIRALPDLPARLAARLEDPAPLQREFALNFVKMAGTPDPAWEPAVRKSIVRLAADYRAEAGDRSAGRITHVKGLAWGTLLAAQTFGPKRFETEVKELRAALASWPDGEERNEALRLLDLYLAGETVPA